MDTLEALGLEIAFPSTTVYIRKDDPETAAAIPGKS